MIDLDELERVCNFLMATGRQNQIPNNMVAENVKELITRLRKAEKDAARYRWLRDECKHGDWHTIGASDPCEWDLIVDGCIDEAMNASNN